MSDKIIAIPSEAEVKKLLEIAMNDKIIHMESVGELLGMKWVDSLLPKIKGEPEWGYEGLTKFFIDHGIEGSDSFTEALGKLK